MQNEWTDRPWEPEFLVADSDLRNIFHRSKDLGEAKEARTLWRNAYPDLQVVIFERTSLTTWVGRFIAKEATIDKRTLNQTDGSSGSENGSLPNQGGGIGDLVESSTPGV